MEDGPEVHAAVNLGVTLPHPAPTCYSAVSARAGQVTSRDLLAMFEPSTDDLTADSGKGSSRSRRSYSQGGGSAPSGYSQAGSLKPKESLAILCRTSCLGTGLGHVLLGLLCVALELVNILIPAHFYWPLVTGLWNGGFFVVTGVAGAVLATHPSRFKVNLYLILSSIGVVASLWGITEGIINLLKLQSCCKVDGTVPSWFEVVPWMKSAASGAEFAICSWVCVLCYKAGYYDDCCCISTVAPTADELYGTSIYSSTNMAATSDASSEFKFQLSHRSPTKMLSVGKIYTPGSIDTTEMTDVSYLEQDI